MSGARVGTNSEPRSQQRRRLQQRWPHAENVGNQETRGGGRGVLGNNEFVSRWAHVPNHRVRERPVHAQKIAPSDRGMHKTWEQTRASPTSLLSSPNTKPKPNPNFNPYPNPTPTLSHGMWALSTTSEGVRIFRNPHKNRHFFFDCLLFTEARKGARYCLLRFSGSRILVNKLCLRNKPKISCISFFFNILISESRVLKESVYVIAQLLNSISRKSSWQIRGFLKGQDNTFFFFFFQQTVRTLLDFHWLTCYWHLIIY